MSEASHDPEPSRRRRMSPEERRDDLLDAAADVLVEQGVDALTMEAVARRAGVSKSLGWAYFTNIGDLVSELFDRELGSLHDHIYEAIEASDSFHTKVRAAVGAYFDVVEDRGAMLAAVQAAAQATSHGKDPAGARTEKLVVALGGLIRVGYDVEWPLAIAHGAAAAALVNTWGQIWGFSAGAMSRSRAEALCVGWLLAGFDASLKKRD